MGATPLDPSVVDRILELQAAGWSRNRIADELGIGRATVSKHVQEAGRTFDRTATEEATRSRRADLLERRSKLELAYIEDAERLRALVWEAREYAQVAGGGETGPDVVRYTTDQPAPQDQLRLMQASTIAAAASQKITDSAVDQSAAAAKSMLVTLMTNLEGAYRAVQAQDLTQPGEDQP